MGRKDKNGGDENQKLVRKIIFGGSGKKPSQEAVRRATRDGEKRRDRDYRRKQQEIEDIKNGVIGKQQRRRKTD